MAGVLFDHADTLIERGIGARIGQQLGWPAERVELARAEWEAYYRALLGPDPSGIARIDCVDMRRDLATLKARAELGEAGAMRAWIAQTQPKPDDLLRTSREGHARMAAQGASAAAAEAAASAVSAATGP